MSGRKPKRALRLDFFYQDGKIRLEKSHAIEAAALPSQLDRSPDAEGYYIEVGSADGALYRRWLNLPVAGDTEVITGDPGSPFTRVANPKASGVFSILVPDFEAAQDIRLVHCHRSKKGGSAKKAEDPRKLSYDRTVLTEARVEEVRKLSQDAARQASQHGKDGKGGKS